VYRYTSQDVCPWNHRFGGSLHDGSPFAAREALAGKDARTLAREVLAMDIETYREAFRGSAMKRVKLPAMKRNAAVVLGNVGTADAIDVLTRALDDPELLVREHAAWALARIVDTATRRSPGVSGSDGGGGVRGSRGARRASRGPAGVPAGPAASAQPASSARTALGAKRAETRSAAAAADVVVNGTRMSGSAAGEWELAGAAPQRAATAVDGAPCAATGPPGCSACSG
jgi:epoxyqueuosine reductase